MPTTHVRFEMPDLLKKVLYDVGVLDAIGVIDVVGVKLVALGLPNDNCA